MGSHQSRRRRRRRPILRGHYGRREKTQKEYKRICSCFMIFPHSSQTKLPGRAHDRQITLRMSTLKSQILNGQAPEPRPNAAKPAGRGWDQRTAWGMEPPPLTEQSPLARQSTANPCHDLVIRTACPRGACCPASSDLTLREGCGTGCTFGAPPRSAAPHHRVSQGYESRKDKGNNSASGSNSVAGTGAASFRSGP